MFIVVVGVFVRAYGERPPERVRFAEDPADESWLGIAEVAELLETGTANVMVLVNRGAIPFFVVADVNRSDPDAYRFRRDEIDAWVIG